jgi:hypothetical protein
METVFISNLELVKCVYNDIVFYDKLSTDTILLINEFLLSNTIILGDVELTNKNFSILVINKKNSNYNKLCNKINENNNLVVFDKIVSYIYNFDDKYINNEYINAIKNIMIETECLQTVNNNSSQLTEYLSDNSDSESNESNKKNTYYIDEVDTLTNI